MLHKRQERPNVRFEKKTKGIVLKLSLQVANNLAIGFHKLPPYNSSNFRRKCSVTTVLMTCPGSFSSC
ncbi:hypothetical protein BDQ17DRAFT_1451611 [Cyathus striatus]|nr:hypothetical protein BDQ17DRAFT_1451611 [Cyathus striatus]